MSRGPEQGLPRRGDEFLEKMTGVSVLTTESAQRKELEKIILKKKL